MSRCCQCNASGYGLRCRRCVCAKAKRACSTCAPDVATEVAAQIALFQLLMFQVSQRLYPSPFFGRFYATKAQCDSCPGKSVSNKSKLRGEFDLHRSRPCAFSTCTEADLVPSRPEQSYCRNVRDYSAADTHRGAPYDDSGGGIAQGPINRSASSSHSPSSTPAHSRSAATVFRAPRWNIAAVPCRPWWGGAIGFPSAKLRSAVGRGKLAFSVPEP